MNERMRTARLILRQWRSEDRPLFAALNADADVMRYFPRTFTRTESDRFVDENQQGISTRGWGAWAIETIDGNEFIGFVGFSEPAVWHPCAGELDVGWRLSKAHWGKGYATEAAYHAVTLGFVQFGFRSIVSFTSECNHPSIGVMKKLGMRQQARGFDHPRIDAASALRRHVVFRLTLDDWIQIRNAPGRPCPLPQ